MDETLPKSGSRKRASESTLEKCGTQEKGERTKKLKENYNINIDSEENKVASCKLCARKGTERSIKMKNSNTSGLIRHLENYHQDAYKDIYGDHNTSGPKKRKDKNMTLIEILYALRLTGRCTGVTGLFYLCFFSALAVFFAICFKGLMATISDKKPTWILDSSLIGSNPGLGYRPISENLDERSLIWYDKGNDTWVDMWVKRLDLFLASYQNTSLLPNGGLNQKNCYFGHSMRPGAVCKVDEKQWGDCSSKTGYGYKNGTPCIFIKLNKIYGWVPVYYDNKADLPKDMPDELRAHISTLNDSQVVYREFSGF